MEIPPLSVSFYIETAMECQPWPSRNKSMFEVLSIIAQAVRTVRQENRQGSLAYFQPVGSARTRARPRRNSASLNPQPVRIKEHRQLLPFCQQLQPSSAAWCSPPPSQMAGRTPHAVSY